MKETRSRIKKARREPSRKGKGPDPNRISIPWGRGASEYRPGLFTKRYLEEHGEACAADIFRTLREDLDHINKERIEVGEKPIRGCTYGSFAKYWHWFKVLGLVELVDRTEPATYDFLEERKFYRLTEAGNAEEDAWRDPVRKAHPEL